MWPELKHACLALTALLLVAGCASTTLQSTWSDPGYSRGPFKRVFVIGLSAKNVTARRVFEDVMAARLQAAGAQAVPAWQYLNNDDQADETALHSVVAKSGADAVLMSRLMGVDTKTSVTTTMVPSPGFGWYGMYSGWYAVPQVTQYQIATVETTLFDVKTKRLVWTATSETFNPTSVQKEAPGLADAVIKSLQAGGFLPVAK